MNVNLERPTPQFAGNPFVFTTVSTEDPGVTYVTFIKNIRRRTDSDMCTCPGFKFRRDCRHMKESTEKLRHIFRAELAGE